jgi:hypothetical protein
MKVKPLSLAIVFVLLCTSALLFAVGSRYLPVRNPTTPAGSAEPDALTRASAEKLINAALEARPWLIRIALGDVVTIDNSGTSWTEYLKLADADVLRVRLCRYPGDWSGPRQICLFDLSDRVRSMIYSGTEVAARVKTIEPLGNENFHPSNRHYETLIVGRLHAKLQDLLRSSIGSAQIRYELTADPNWLAQAFRLNPDLETTRIATLRLRGRTWEIEADGVSSP